tara:strand:+ start:629 stop:985 length:357 start_codon:yes stop_codon:yes gene_type:complete
MASESNVKSTEAVTAAEFKGFRNAVLNGKGSFKAGGRFHTVASLQRKIRKMMSPSDYARLMEGANIRDVRKTKGGRRQIDVMYAKDGALVSTSKKKTTPTKKKKVNKGHSKYSCGLFK